MDLVSPDNRAAAAHVAVKLRQLQRELGWQRDFGGELEPGATGGYVDHHAGRNHRAVTVYYQHWLRNAAAPCFSIFFAHWTVSDTSPVVVSVSGGAHPAD